MAGEALRAVTATCHRCGGKYGHPGPCPRCVPYNGYRVDLAASIAFDMHRMQFRKGRGRNDHGPNFIVHPASCVKLLYHWGFSVSHHGELFEVMWLHDGPEDFVDANGPNPDAALERIAKELGDITAGYVRELTRYPGEDKQEYKGSFGSKSVVALIDKVADQCDNLHDFLDTDPRYARKYFQGAAPIFDVLRARQVEVVERAGRASSPFPDQCRQNGETIYDAMCRTIADIAAKLG